MPLELHVFKPYRNDSGQTFSVILADERRKFFVFNQIVLLCVIIENFRAGGLETDLVSASVGRRYIVYETENIFGISRRVLHRYFQFYAVLLGRKVYGFGINCVFFGVDITYEIGQAAFVMIGFMLARASFGFGTVVV